MPSALNWELERVILLESTSKKHTGPTVKDITSLSADTIKRRYAKKVLRMSEKRVGMKMRDALEIAASNSK